MPTFDNYIDRTVKQYHGRPIQKRMRILWFFAACGLSILWSILASNTAINGKQCFVRYTPLTEQY